MCFGDVHQVLGLFNRFKNPYTEFGFVEIDFYIFDGSLPVLVALAHTHYARAYS